MSAESLHRPEDVFGELNRRGIRYCHWKSNSHVDAGLDGRTDLDLLFDVRESAEVTTVLAAHGYKRFTTDPSRYLPGVEDHLGVHADTGRLLHLQVHYRLHAGKRHVKNYRLSWEDELLDTRVWDEQRRLFVAEPAHELLLLVLRVALKVRGRDRVARIWRSGVPEELRDECRWLLERTDESGSVRLATQRYGPEVAELVANALGSELAFGTVLELRRCLRGLMKDARVRGPVMAFLEAIRREARWMIGSINRKWMHRPFSYARSAPGGGVIVAVVGVDGSGKSTLMNELHTWLAGKADVMPVYFGSGKGPVSVFRMPLVAARGLSRRFQRRPVDQQHGVGRSIPGPAKAIWALLVAREKRIRFQRAFRARERGLIVLADRFPQTEIAGMIDSPLLSDWATSRSGILRWLAKWERAPYSLAETVGPDLVLRLNVDLQTVQKRRPDEDLKILAARSQVVDSLSFKNARYGLCEIDGTRSHREVELEAKAAIWRIL